MPPAFTRDIQPALLWNIQTLPPDLPLRDYHPLWCGFPANFRFVIWKYRSPNTTSPLPFGKGFGLPCAVFTRRYSRHRFCFLFLRVLRCFSPPRSRSLTGPFRRTGSPIRRSPDHRLLAPTRRLSQLDTTFIGARAEPSPKRRSSRKMSA